MSTRDLIILPTRPKIGRKINRIQEKGDSHFRIQNPNRAVDLVYKSPRRLWNRLAFNGTYGRLCQPELELYQTVRSSY